MHPRPDAHAFQGADRKGAFMKSINGFGLSMSSMTAAALSCAMLLAGESSAGTATGQRTGADTTVPGPGTGLHGFGKGPAPVLLGKAGEYVILAKTGISKTGTTDITGNIGVSPVAASYITGFSLLDPPGTYATSPAVTGRVYASDYDSPTPANLTTAVLDMQTAYSDAAARAPDYIELGAGDIGGLTLAPAVYKWSTDLLIPSDVTLLGGPYDVWIFEIAGDLTQTSGVRITLQGGALPKNIFWQVAGASTHETTSHFEGVLLSQTAIIMKTGATANGRQLAQSNVVLDANTVVQPDESPNPLYRQSPGRFVKIHFFPVGEMLAVDVGPASAIRTLSVFGTNGILRHQESIPAGRARTLVPISLSPVKGNLYRVK
jgi:hypothetical protein